MRLLRHPVHLWMRRNGLELLVKIVNQSFYNVAVLRVLLAAIICLIVLTVKLNGLVLVSRQIALEGREHTQFKTTRAVLSQVLADFLLQQRSKQLLLDRHLYLSHFTCAMFMAVHIACMAPATQINGVEPANDQTRQRSLSLSAIKLISRRQRHLMSKAE